MKRTRNRWLHFSILLVWIAVSVQSTVYANSPILVSPKSKNSSSSSVSSSVADTPLSIVSSVVSSIQSSISVLQNSSVSSTPSTAQPNTIEQLSIFKGDIFEILADSDFLAPNFNWVLTENNTLLIASKEKVFKYRFSNAGNFILTGSIYNQAGTSEIKKTIFTKL